MRAQFKLTNPNDVEATVQLTMTIAGWRKFLEQLGASNLSIGYPMYRVQNLVRKVIEDAEEHFDAEHVEAD